MLESPCFPTSCPSAESSRSSPLWPTSSLHPAGYLTAQVYAGWLVLRHPTDRKVPGTRPGPVASPARRLALRHCPAAPRSTGSQPQDPPKPCRQPQGSGSTLCRPEAPERPWLLLTPAWQALYDQSRIGACVSAFRASSGTARPSASIPLPSPTRPSKPSSTTPARCSSQLSRDLHKQITRCWNRATEGARLAPDEPDGPRLPPDSRLSPLGAPSSLAWSMTSTPTLPC